MGGLPARGVLPPVGQGEEGRPPRGALHGQVLNLKLHPPYKYSDVQGQSNRQVGFILILNHHPEIMFVTSITSSACVKLLLLG